jgi:hypothetical protein
VGWGDKNGNGEATRVTQGAGASGPLGEMMEGKAVPRCAGNLLFFI